MDRACRECSGADRRRGGPLRGVWLLALLALGCKELTGSFDRVVALEIVGSTSPSVEEGDTVRLVARALDASGALIADAPVFWAILDTGQARFALDSATGLVSATTPGSNRVQARTGTLRSAPLTVTVTGAPDTVAAGGEQRLSVAAGAAQSGALVTAVFDLTTAPGQSLPLAGKPVDYQLVLPEPGSATAAGFFLTPGDTLPGADRHRVTARTGTGAQASIVVRKQPGAALPDSAVIDATARSARGAVVPGSPLRFVVVFQPS